MVYIYEDLLGPLLTKGKPTLYCHCVYKGGYIQSGMVYNGEYISCTSIEPKNSNIRRGPIEDWGGGQAVVVQVVKTRFYMLDMGSSLEMANTWERGGEGEVSI